MRIKIVLRTIATGGLALAASVFVPGCDFNPAKYFSRNACDFLNCDVLFFVEDLLPLSGGPVASAGGGAEADAEGGGGGHMH